MSHLDYYQYQAEARGVQDPADVIRLANEQGFIYQQMAGPWLPADRSALIVDLACGHGSFLYWLHSQGFSNALGVDSSAEQIAMARGAGLKVEQADALEWLERASPRSLTNIVAIDFIEHISKDDFMRFLAASSRALAPKGQLILRYPNGDSPLVGLNLFNDITHVWTYTSNCLTTLARMHGFGRVEFADQSVQAIRDHRWLKVPLARVAQFLFCALLHAASRERVRYLNSNIWARLLR